MPTNKLWIEHTERAAWESVLALRERLEQAEGRLRENAAIMESLQPLLDVLAEAKRRHAPDAKAHAEIVAQLLSRLEQQQATLELAKTASGGAAARSWSAQPGADDEDSCVRAPRETRESRLAAFIRLMQRHDEQRRGRAARDLDRLLSLAEDKLDDLGELDGAALREGAIELALLASEMYTAAERT